MMFATNKNSEDREPKANVHNFSDSVTKILKYLHPDDRWPLSSRLTPNGLP